MTNTLYWFTHDLRLQDNPALSRALMTSNHIAFVYVIDPSLFKQTNYQHKSIGQHRWAFIVSSLASLDQQLRQYGHQLTILEGNTVNEISDFIAQHQINQVASAEQIGWFEQRNWDYLAQSFPQVRFQAQWNSTLFEPEQLDISAPALATFSRFRKQLEKQRIQPQPCCRLLLDALVPPVATLASAPVCFTNLYAQYETAPQVQSPLFKGGEQAAMAHLNTYFSQQAASTYKETRNALDGWTQSTKFSPYLASGNVSTRQIWQQLTRYEAQHGANESSYWIGFELWWREYFQWLARVQGAQLFSFQGMAQQRPLTSFYAERFLKWCQGRTPYPLVNACMRQLNATGYMSNRGRQIVASCLVNELSLDWRFGAAYFQQQLIDYDVASNWGNWQYIAGVGADPRGGRHFNLDKQTQIYDPQEHFIAQWQGRLYMEMLDSVDAADWPIGLNESL
ncbi:MAG: DASH family cryptochrome [Oceanisphaera sp.]|uniref:DASH family cryptochrome n=1 Tax=Oceanisphaera sp. TaxID=1929979 RepID=UPI003F96A35D